jgi:rRNA maturation protein Nop10
MRTVAADTLLSHWENGHGRTPAARALDLLVAVSLYAADDEPPWSVCGRDPGRWTVGHRDAALLSLHASSLGRPLEAVAACPACGGRAEFELDAESLAAQADTEVSGQLTIRAEGHVVRCHVPTTADLATVTGTGTESVDDLLATCVDSATADGRPVAATDLPPRVREAVESALEEADADAETTLSLTCPECGHRWTAPLDPAAFVCAELDREALALAREVRELATAYGWSERDILAMSPSRRRLYLEVDR